MELKIIVSIFYSYIYRPKFIIYFIFFILPFHYEDVRKFISKLAKNCTLFRVQV